MLLYLQDWYHNTSDNDLLYWGLDYPPLTAYHSWMLGVAAAAVNSSWVELHDSRGMETLEHKLMMRISVIIADLLILFPAIFMFSSSSNRYLTVVTLLAYPGLIIIDHGHFQYNNISLGLALAAISLVTRSQHSLGSLLFVCSLNYKQMELYHALPFFFYLLGICCQQRSWTLKIVKLVQIGLTVIGSFALIWSPFIYYGTDSVLQVVTRIFPFARGVFEDKVANFWCALDVVYKLKQKMAVPDLAKLCLGTTFTLSIPTNLHLLWSPSQRNFILGLVNTSLIFFLFSFQVHEKSILLAAIPMCLLTFTETEPIIIRTIVPWMLTISTFSMLPLLTKEGLLIPTIALSVLYLNLSSNYETLTSIGLEKSRSQRTQSPAPLPPTTLTDAIINIISYISIIGCILLVIMSQTIPPPEQYPYLWSLLICIYSAAHFILATIYFHIIQFTSQHDISKMKQKKTN